MRIQEEATLGQGHRLFVVFDVYDWIPHLPGPCIHNGLDIR